MASILGPPLLSSNELVIQGQEFYEQESFSVSERQMGSASSPFVFQGFWKCQNSSQQQFQPIWEIHPGQLPGERHRERVSQLVPTLCTPPLVWGPGLPCRGTQDWVSRELNAEVMILQAFVNHEGKRV